MTRYVWVEFEGDEPYHVLLATADALLNADHFGAAVVTGQTACEVITEEAISFWLLREMEPWDRRWNEVAEALMDSFQTFTLTNERLRRLYVIVSKDPIQDEPFWSRYVEHVRLRHRVAHKGYITTKDEAEQSLAVAREFVEHIKGTFPSRPEGIPEGI
jgi:hypothetical protein